MYEQVKAAILRTPSAVDQLIRYSNVSRNLERIADLATNIAEDVIYMCRGDILRHLPPQEPVRRDSTPRARDRHS
jgi:phosphate transport system protein